MKKTKREYYNEILAIEGISEDIKKFVNAELALLDKKNSNRKPTKEQKANEDYKAQIIAILANAENPLTASEIHKTVKYDGEYQVQKTSALLAQLVKTNEVAKGTDGKKTVFSLSDDPAEDTEDEVEDLENEVEDTEEPADAE